MFTDIHTHILPGIDDGCRDLSQSLSLIESAIENNVSNIILTPHFLSGDLKQSPDKKTIESGIKELQQYLDKYLEKPDRIRLFAGSEVRLSPFLPSLLNRDDLLIKINTSHMLIDIPFLGLPPYLFDMLFRLRASGITPIFAHPERYRFLSGKTDIVEKIKDAGCLIQVDNSSLVNKNDSDTYFFAARLLKKGLVDLIASDCHYTPGRYSNFMPAYRTLSRLLGKKEAERIAVENPNNIIGIMVKA
jgi:protein-tyrosine phosphatase